MNKFKRKYMLIFFGILIILMIAAYIINIIIPPPTHKTGAGLYDYTEVKNASICFTEAIIESGL